jgi:peptidoglycan/LPS O-acetylase OafA/YrhL
MDALRASTMLLLVPVHTAGILGSNGRGGAWAVGLYWVIHVFRLPLFFAMSGFFLALLLNGKGLAATARNRTLRIAVPLAVGMVTLVPLAIGLGEVTGVGRTGDGRLIDGSPFRLQPSFLWFLWYLLILDGIAISIYLLAPGLLRKVSSGIRTAVASPLLGISLLAVPTALALWPQGDWTAAPGAGSFVPNPSTFSYNALFFCLGATLCVHRELVEEIRRDAWKWTACALATTLLAGALFTFHNSPAYASRIEVHGAALMIYSVATWTSLMALIGLASRYLNRPRPALRYLADSSYWIYLSHMPAMVLLVALVGSTALGTAPQFALVTMGSLAFSLLTYPLFVRYTAIGRVLNGPRKRMKRRRPLGPKPALSPSPSLTR